MSFLDAFSDSLLVTSWLLPGLLFRILFGHVFYIIVAWIFDRCVLDVAIDVEAILGGQNHPK